MKKSSVRFLSRRSAVLLWFVGFFALAAIIVHPISLGLTRMLGAVLAGLLTLGLLLLCWRYRVLRWMLLLLYGCAAVFMMLPGNRNYDRVALRQEVAKALLRYDGVRYYWGGEGFRGIDCSGLIRRGVIDGTFIYGARTLNPLLVRKAIVFWWHDLTAREMGEGAHGLARKISEEKSIALLNEKNMHPGDFAITRGGIHALVFLGEHIWLEADPGEMKVLQVNARATKNPWFYQPITILRWRFLEAPYQKGK